jgi:glycosyltransferase involved in cell wall biosynthesis
MPNFANQIQSMIHEYGLRDEFIMLGLIDRKDQIMLIRNSVGLIQPSLHEGWNTAVEEAKALGKSIILSDIPTHIEQKMENGYYFKANDYVDLTKKMLDMWSLSKSSFQKEIEDESFQRYHEKDIKEFARNFINIFS